MVPLGVIDSEATKLFQGRLVLNAFGDRLDVELLRDSDHCPDDLLVVPVVEQIPDELDIDLEEVDGQVPEVREASVADAEVVQGEGASEFAQSLSKCPCRRQVVGSGGLGDLEGEVLRWRSAAPDGPLDPTYLRVVADRLGR